jgi:hypothetical protein
MRRGEKMPALMALWHPGTEDTLSGYGLVLAPLHLVGLVMVDRPTVADPQWLAKIAQAFGPYQLAIMSQQGERGLVCQMVILPHSAQHLRPLVHPLRAALTQALMPLVHDPPAVTLVLMWDAASATWVSQPWTGGRV